MNLDLAPYPAEQAIADEKRRVLEAKLAPLDNSLFCFASLIKSDCQELTAMLFPVVDNTARPIVIARTHPEKAWNIWNQFRDNTNGSLQVMFNELARFYEIEPKSDSAKTENAYPFLPKGFDLAGLDKIRKAQVLVLEERVPGTGVAAENKIRLTLQGLQDIGMALNTTLPQTPEQFAEFLGGREQSCQKLAHVFGPIISIMRAHRGPDFPPDEEIDNLQNCRPRSPKKHRSNRAIVPSDGLGGSETAPHLVFQTIEAETSLALTR